MIPLENFSLQIIMLVLQGTVLITHREGGQKLWRTKKSFNIYPIFCPYEANGLNISENWSTLDVDSIG